MGKAYNGGFTASTGFKRTDASPLDDSEIVEFLADLTNGTIDKPYLLMIVGVLEDLNHYKWNGTNWVNITTASSSDATTLQGLAPSSAADEDAHVVATDSSGRISSWFVGTAGIESTFIGLNKAAETVEPTQSNTVTLGLIDVDNRHVFKNVPIELFKQYLTSAGLDATTLQGLAPSNTAAQDAHVVATDSTGEAQVFFMNTAILRGADIELDQVPETIEPSQAHTVTLGLPSAFNRHAFKNVPIALFKAFLFDSIIDSDITSSGLITANAGFISNGGFRVNQTGSYLDVFTTSPMGKAFMTWNKTVNGVTNLKGFFGFAHTTGLDDDIYLVSHSPTGRIRFGTGARATYNDIIINIDGSVDIKKLNSEILSLIKAQETSVPAQTDTITMGVPGANNYHSFRNVPKYLFKEYLFESTDTSFAQLPVTASVTFTTLSFRRKDGRVLIKGTWTGNSTGSNTTIANLPAGSRPLVEEFTSCHRGNQEMIPIKIDTNGDIKIGTHVTGQDYSMTIEFIIDKTL